MDDSDSEFSDVGEEVDLPGAGKSKKAKVNKNGVKVIGEAQAWKEVNRFANAEEFNKSDIAQKLKKEFSCRKKREFEYADVHEYECKHSRKVGYIPCPWTFKEVLLKSF